MTPDPSAPHYPNQPQIQPQVSVQPQPYGANNYGQIGGIPNYQPQPIVVGQAPFVMMQPAAFASTSATAALVLSILGILGSFCYGIGCIFILISVILCFGNGSVIRANPMHPDRNTHRTAVVINWITIVLSLILIIPVLGSGVLYVWASSLAEGEVQDYQSLYDFSSYDAYGAVTSASDDNLIRIDMEQGDDLPWNSIYIYISVDGAFPILCDKPGQSGGECGAIEYGDTSDGFWSVGDGVTIVESGSNLCSFSCDIEFEIVDNREGVTIAEGSVVAY